jgi:hypothetical protein
LRVGPIARGVSDRIGAKKVGLASAARDFRNDGLSLVATAIAEDDGSACAGQAEGHGPANA